MQQSHHWVLTKENETNILACRRDICTHMLGIGSVSNSQGMEGILFPLSGKAEKKSHIYTQWSVTDLKNDRVPSTCNNIKDVEGTTLG